MANIRKEPTKCITLRVPQHMWGYFYEYFEKETRNRSLLEIIKNSQSYKTYEYEKKRNELNEPNLFN